MVIPILHISKKCRNEYNDNGSFSVTTSTTDTGFNMAEHGESSSLNNVFAYQELGQASSNELKNQFRVLVDQPEKVLTTLDTFITFRVITKTTLSSFNQPEHQVRRRYSDFAWLRQHLETQFPLYILPALPEKHSVYSLDRYDSEFIRFRCMGLHLFMNWLLKHISPLDNLDLHNFLHLVDGDQWLTYQKTKPNLALETLSTSISGLKVPALEHKSLAGVDKGSEFNVHNDYCSKLGQTLLSLDKMGVKMLKAEQDYLKELECFHTVFNYWGESESNSELRAVAATAAAALKTNVDTLTATTGRFEPQFIVPAHQFSLFTDAVRCVLRKRDNIEREHKNAVENFQKKTVEYELLLRTTENGSSSSNDMSASISGDRNKYTDSKLTKLVQQIKELNKNVEKWSLALKQANVEVHSELKRWLRLKDSELKHLIASVAKQRVDMHRQCLTKWEAALNATGNDC